MAAGAYGNQKSIKWDKEEKTKDDAFCNLEKTQGRFISEDINIPQIKKFRGISHWNLEKNKKEMQYSSQSKEISRQEFDNLRNELIELKREVLDLKSQLKSKQRIDDLWRESEENAKFLECIFKIDDKKIKTAEQALSELGGILKDCKREGVDSVTLVHSIRGD